jgi:hypothetical protein
VAEFTVEKGKRKTLRRASWVLVGALLMFACSSASEETLLGPEDEDLPSGGQAADGGASIGGGTLVGGRDPAGGSASGGSSSGGVSSLGGRANGGAEPSGGAIGGAAAAGGVAAAGGTLSAGGHSATGGAGNGCPFSGNISYTLTKAGSPTADQTAAYEKIDAAMSKAVEFYNCYTDITKVIVAQYVPSVDTADGNPNGSIRFGKESYMNFVTAMHEISHVLGVGADNGFDQLIKNGVYTGPLATARLRELTSDPEAEIHGDTQHFWPYGLNYESEWHSEQDGIFHCYLVTAMRQDMGWE